MEVEGRDLLRLLGGPSFYFEGRREFMRFLIVASY